MMHNFETNNFTVGALNNMSKYIGNMMLRLKFDLEIIN